MIQVGKNAGFSQTTSYRGPERRVEPRMGKRFETRVQGGVEDTGELFDVTTRLDNISAGGLYVRLPHKVEVGSRLALTVRFTENDLPGLRAPLLALHGTVRRAEAQADGGCGVAVEFKHHIFL